MIVPSTSELEEEFTVRILIRCEAVMQVFDSNEVMMQKGEMFCAFGLRCDMHQRQDEHVGQ